MSNMFHSATVRLTIWYIATLMSISIIFSMAIYQMASSEVQMRLEHFQTTFQQSRDFKPPITRMTAFRANEIVNARSNLSIELFYVNLIILSLGGFGSYFLARRNLLPIEKAHEAQSRFTSDASHEFRTPLAVMKTELEVVLKDDNATVKELRKVLRSNIEEVDKLSKLAEMLLNLSHLDNAKLELSPIDLAKISADVIDSFNKPSDRILFNSNKQIIINGNETALFDLIKVLVDNALQYSPKDSQIIINLSKTDKLAKLEITNTGHGIPEDKLPYIFDRFYRADSSRTSGRQKGYGLGLALAKSIAELHNGNIEVISEPDHDTTFTLSLPLGSPIV